MEWLMLSETWVGLLTLTALEIILGIDNIIFVSIIAGKLPIEEQARGRKVGLLLALLLRIVLLMLIGLILRLQNPLLFGLSGQDMVLVIGGLFLIAKSVKEIHHKLEAEEEVLDIRPVKNAFGVIIVQIMLMNLVFSIDSIVTAIGMVKQVEVMVMAVILSTFVMIGSAGPVSKFVEAHPTVKMLALSFLILIGGNLIMEGFHVHIPKGYTYFAMGFAVFVEMLNLRLGRTAKTPVELRNSPTLEEVEGQEEAK
jgi:predicted tellurium resistance membrane protein TerC